MTVRSINTSAWPVRAASDLSIACALCLTLAIGLAGCGTGDSAVRPEAGAALRIRFMPHGESGPVRHWTLTCDPPGGSHPRPRRACEELAASPGALAPARQACIVAPVEGAPIALVAGRTGSGRVDRTVRPGCGGAWRRLHVLLTGR